MNTKLFLCFVVTAVVSFPLISCSKVPNHDGLLLDRAENVPFQRVRKMFTELVENGTVQPDQIKWHPERISDNDLFTELCNNNEEGNYQIPTDCDKFIMCAGGGLVYLVQCPGGLQYDAFADACVNQNPIYHCPWPEIWSPGADPSCEHVGERPWWGPLTLAVNPLETCGSEISICMNFKVLSYGLCPPGFGFSKAFLACLDMDTCKKSDEKSGLAR